MAGRRGHRRRLCRAHGWPLRRYRAEQRRIQLPGWRPQGVLQPVSIRRRRARRMERPRRRNDHERFRCRECPHRFRESIHAEHQIFSGRTAFRIRPIFLSWRNRPAALAHVLRTDTAMARDDPAGRRRIRSDLDRVRAVHLERRRGTTRQSLFHERLCRDAVPDAAARFGAGPGRRLARRRAVHGEDARQPVRRRQVSESDHRTRIRSPSPGGTDDGERSADHAGGGTGAFVVQRCADVFPG